MKKRFLSIILVLSIILISTISYGEINIESKSSLLMDYSSGKILYANNENEKLAPASITKIMTLLIVMESIKNNKIQLNDEVQISKYASS
ncbi:MAG: serine hydrolase, partial [Tissierella sp.]|uniref:serine hydrolase n=1 Tax=Tissierella sp. TaxID=41274 RepID=UPI003F94A771